MKNLFIAALISLTIINPVYADEATPIKKGDPSPYTGTVLDTEKANKIKDQLIERDSFEKENQSYKKSIDLYKSSETILYGQKDMLLNQNIELTKTLNDTRSTSDWLKVGYFVLGVAVTGLAVYGASRLNR